MFFFQSPDEVFGCHDMWLFLICALVPTAAIRRDQEYLDGT